MEQYAELAAAVREAKNTHGPFAAVTIIVPTQGGALDVTRHLARALSDLGGLVNVAAADLPSLAAELFLDSAETRGRRQVTPLLREASARASLGQHPGLFGKLAARQATVQAVARTSATLDGISDEQLAALETTPLLGEILAHHRSIRRALESSSYFPDEVSRVAATRLAEPAVRAKLGTVIIFCLPTPQRLLEREFLAAIERTLTPQRITPATGTNTELITGAELISMTDADEEARAIARLVAEELASGTPGHRIGIFVPASTPYRALLDRHLTHAGIAWTGAAPRQLIDTSVARNLLRFLAADTDNFDFRLVLDAMAERALLPPGKDFPTPAQAERIYRHTARDDEEETEQTTSWQRAEAERRERFRTYVAELAAELGNARNESTWLRVANSLQKLVNDHFSPAKSGPVFRSAGGGAGGGAGGSGFERPVIWREELALAISSLGTLDGLAPAPSPKAIREQLEAAITSRQLRHGKMGSGVLIASLSSGPARDLDLVIVCGLAEGIAPPRVYENPLLPDSVIEALGSPVPTSLEQVNALRQDFLQTLRSGSRRRVLTYPRGDLRGGGLRVLSRWVSAAHASAEDIRPLVVGSFQEGMLTGSPTGAARYGDGSIGAGTGTATGTGANSGSSPIAVTEQARAVASFRANPHLLEAVDPDSDLGASLALRRDRRRGVFSRFNGNLSNVAEFIDVLDRPISPTSVEMYRKTPLSYFLQHVLRARALNDVVQSPELDSLVRGTLIHEILEHWILDYLAGAHTGDVASLILQAETTSARFKEEIGGFWIEQFWLIAKNEIFEDLRQWHTVNDGILADGWIPVGAEANFPTLTEGRTEAEGDAPAQADDSTSLPTPRLPTVDIDLVDGSGQLSFQGQIDRYDRQPDGSIHVIDYKGGKNKGFDSLSADNPTADGYKYQLAVYGRLAQILVAEEGTDGSVRASYWFVRREDAKHPMVSIRMNDAVMKKLAEDLTVLAHDVRAGAFPPISGPFDTYSTMIGIERVDSLWDRISSSPELNSITTFWREAPEAEELV